MEEWKDIKGYEGLYQVSNEGRVKSLDHTIVCDNGKGVATKKQKGKILRSFSRKNNVSVWGIYSVCNGKQKTAYGYIWLYNDINQ